MLAAFFLECPTSSGSAPKVPHKNHTSCLPSLQLSCRPCITPLATYTHYYFTFTDVLSASRMCCTQPQVRKERDSIMYTPTFNILLRYPGHPNKISGPHARYGNHVITNIRLTISACAIFDKMMLLLVWCLLLPASSLCDRVIRIHQLDGNDTETCLSYSTGKIPCRTLEYVFAGIRGKSDVTIYIDTNITLKGIMVLENMTDISISGSDQVVTNHRIKTVACSENTVLLFTNITNINLLNLELNGCGAYKEAAIVFNISSRILLVNTTIRKAHVRVLLS